MSISNRWLVSLLALAPLLASAAVDVLVSDGAGKPLAGAVVWLESPAAQAAAKPLQNMEIAQANRQFQPQVTVITVGTAVAFPNRDTVRHHVYSFSPTKTFELKLYVGTPLAPVVLIRPA